MTGVQTCALPICFPVTILAQYQLMYAEEHKNADVQYLTLTDEEYDEMFPYEEDE